MLFKLETSRLLLIVPQASPPRHPTPAASRRQVGRDTTNVYSIANT
jgi:hypothetical protein